MTFGESAPKTLKQVPPFFIRRLDEVFVIGKESVLQLANQLTWERGENPGCSSRAWGITRLFKRAQRGTQGGLKIGSCWKLEKGGKKDSSP